MDQSLAALKKNNLSLFGFKDSTSLILSEETYRAWQSFIYDLCGIYFQDSKKYFLESRLQKRMSHLELETFEDYLEYVKNKSDRAGEIKYLFEAITINETYFFRNQPQLDALVSKVIPEVVSMSNESGTKKLRIWSAGSSSGEECYSIAMVIKELIIPKYPNLSVEIIGTDINFQSVENAKKGSFRQYSIRNTPAFYLKKYFVKNGNNYDLDRDIKNMVNFKLLNLYDGVGMRSMINLDVIFCANVLIYFDTKSKTKVISSIYNSLNPGGYLFIGYSETLHNVSKAFKLVSFPKTIGYKKE